MNIGSTTKSPAPQTPSRPPVSERIATYVSDEPVDLLVHVAEIGVGASLAFGQNYGMGEGMNWMAGLSSAYNAMCSFDKMIEKGNWGTAYTDQRRSLGLEAAEHALTAAGLGMAAGGMGPISLLPLALGKGAALLNATPKQSVFQATKTVAESPGAVTKELFRETPSRAKSRAWERSR